MNSRRERPAPPRLHLRHFLIANTFVAVAMGAFVYARRAGDVTSPGFLAASLAMPLALNLLATILIGPGPGRNLVRIAMTSAFSMAVAMLASFPVGSFVAREAIRTASIVPGDAGLSALIWATRTIFHVSLMIMSIGLYAATFQFWSRLVPDRCPRCARRGLVDGRVGWVGLTRTTHQAPHDHAWCLACSSRLKRARADGPLAPWRDASSPVDDRHYSLWTPASAFRRRADPASASGRFSTTPGPRRGRGTSRSSPRAG